MNFHLNFKLGFYALTLLSGLLCLPAITNANHNDQNVELSYVYIPTCYGLETSPFSYESCVNSGFRTIESKINRMLSNCYGAKHSAFSFESCVNRNFNTIEMTVRNVYLSYCSGVEHSPFNFESCVNRNFNELERVL